MDSEHIDLESGGYMLPFEPELHVSSLDTSVENDFFYHAVREEEDLWKILEDESVKSPARQQMETEEYPDRTVKEDLMRIYGEKLEDEFDLKEVVKENEDVLKRYGSEQTRQVLETDEFYNFLDYLGSSAQVNMNDRGDGWRNYAVSVSNEFRGQARHFGKKSATFEFSLPVVAVKDPYTIDGNVVGEIPLEYAIRIYVGPEADESLGQRLEEHYAVNNHGIDVEDW